MTQMYTKEMIIDVLNHYDYDYKRSFKDYYKDKSALKIELMKIIDGIERKLSDIKERKFIKEENKSKRKFNEIYYKL